MAEYVRRRRPPPAHPYWERLRDRTNPPRRLVPIIVTSLVGLYIGLYGGLRSALSIDSAISQATTYASVLAALAFVLILPFSLFNGARQLSHRERWPVALMLTLFIAVFCFVLSFLAIALVMVWYSLCSGQGAWLGMLIGISVIAVPTTFFVFLNRRRWEKRQRDWPRWERLRTSRRRSTLRVTVIPHMPESESEAASPGDSGRSSAPESTTHSNNG